LVRLTEMAKRVVKQAGKKKEIGKKASGLGDGIGENSVRDRTVRVVVVARGK